MDSSQLPVELTVLESELRRLAAVGAPPDLRGRVFLAINQEMLRERRRAWARYAVSVAAILLLWANLSWMASRDTARRSSVYEETPATFAKIRALLPELSEREAARMAFLLDGGRAVSAHGVGSPRSHRFTSF